jgi:cytochrome c-type biogenesis protein CcmE
VELTPRTAPDPSGPQAPSRRRSPWAYLALVAVLVGVGVVAYQGLTSASLYFYNADEALAQRRALGEKRIRVQGTVQEGVSESDERVEFKIAFDDRELLVVHDGDPPELFEPGIPVVLEGHFDPGDDLRGPDRPVFLSDEILVKHDEQYEAENSERLDDAEDGRSDDTAP